MNINITTLLEDYIAENGRPTAYSEEDEVKVLPLESIAEVSRLANLTKTVILGGDFYVFNEKKQALDYAIIVLGEEFVYLNWYYNPNPDITLAENCSQSILKAQEAIKTAQNAGYHEVFFSLVLLDLNKDEFTFKNN